MKSYKTVAGRKSAEYIVKKSRFIGHAAPVKTQQEALDFINEIKSEYWDATHNVYAYVLSENNVSRYSDDGEPQGTAGVPSLDVLKKEELVDTAVVVTRYFGGIMLGAGGLVRAYSHTAKLAVDAAEIITMAQCALCDCQTDYNFYGRLVPLLHAHGAKVSNVDFAVGVNVSFSIRADGFEKLNAEIIDLSNGRFSAETLGEEFMRI